MIFYSTTIFGFAGFNDSILATVSVGAVNVLTTMLASRVVDQMGRKTLLLGGKYACVELVCLCCYGVWLYIGTSTMFVSLVVLSGVLGYGNSLGEATQGLIAVVSVLVYIFGFAIGLGAVCWVVMSEIMPQRLRTKAVSLFLSLNWGANLIIGLVTLTAIEALGGVKHGMSEDEKSDAEKTGVAYLYFIFAIISLLGLVFIKLVVPETKGKSPEEVMGRIHSKGVANFSPLLASLSEVGSEKSFNI